MPQDLIKQFGGPYFDFVAVPKAEDWKQRADKGFSLLQNRESYFHNPKALKIPDCVISLVVWCFINSHPKFNYYGDTEFNDDNLIKLIQLFEKRVSQLKSCRTKEDFQTLTTEHFEYYCEEDLNGWRKHFPAIRDEVVESLEKIIELAKKTDKENKVLLVLGV